MNKKMILIVFCIFMVIVCWRGYLILKDNLTNNVQKEENNKLNNLTNNKDIVNKNSVVLYFSVTNNTKKIAEYISEVSNSNLIQIIPEKAYTSDDINYNNDDSRANKEQNNETARPKIKGHLDIDEYDTIYLGFPIWWGNVPKIILTLFDEYDLDGKTVVPFCTSGSSDISTAENTLKSYNKKVILKKGQRFSKNTTKENIKKWLKN